MTWLTKTKFNSVSMAFEHPDNCKTLDVFLTKDELDAFNQICPRLKNLTRLFVHAHESLYKEKDFSLPEELGQLTRLEKLSFLNLPFKEFPSWILNLRQLNYLMIRGSDLDALPGSIGQLKELTTLRIENCPLTTLPIGLKDLHKLKGLGLSDTRLTTIDTTALPTRLRRINLAGSPMHSSEIRINNRKVKLAHVV